MNSPYGLQISALEGYVGDTITITSNYTNNLTSLQVTLDYETLYNISRDTSKFMFVIPAIVKSGTLYIDTKYERDYSLPFTLLNKMLEPFATIDLNNDYDNYAMDISPDGSKLAVIVYSKSQPDSTIRIYDISSTKLINEIKCNRPVSYYSYVFWCMNGDSLVLSTDSYVQLWDIRTKSLLKELQTGTIYGLGFSPQLNALAFSDPESNYIGLNSSVLEVHKFDPDGKSSFVFAGNGRYLFTRNGSMLEKWKINNEKPELSEEVNLGDMINDICASPDEQKIAVITDKKILVYHVEDLAPVDSFIIPMVGRFFVMDIKTHWLNNNDFYSIAHPSTSGLIWNSKTRKYDMNLSGSGYPFEPVSRGSILATSGRNQHTISFWHLGE